MYQEGTGVSEAGGSGGDNYYQDEYQRNTGTANDGSYGRIMPDISQQHLNLLIPPPIAAAAPMDSYQNRSMSYV